MKSPCIRILITAAILSIAMLPAACSVAPDPGHGPVAESLDGASDADATPLSLDTPLTAMSPDLDSSSELATLGAGCFWCVEAVLEQLDGVSGVTSGYMGGQVDNPTYKAVCTGTTGHAEVVQVTFDPSVVSYAKLLNWFWKLHDPTTLNRQGADRGTQYRSAIFYHSEAQRAVAEQSKKEVEEAGVFDDPIVTEITAASTYYNAEGYHQDYYRANKEQSYCRMVISPKLEKLGLEK